MATIKDVAQKAGVSISTVSIVLNGQSGERKIPKATQERVLKAVAELNYQPNLSARKLRSAGKDEYTIGLYWAADTRIICLARVLQGLQRAIAESGKAIRIVVCPFTPGKLHEDHALNSMTAYNAVIIATINAVDIAYLEQNPPLVPTILYNRFSKRFPGVGMDNEAVGQMAAEHLLQQGFTRMGCVHHHNSFLAMRARGNSFQDCCRQRGIEIPEAHIVYTDDTLEGGFIAGEEFIRRGNLPDAIYCDTDQLALGLLSAFQKHGIGVPEDVRVLAIGMGLPDLCRYSLPSITAVELPLVEMACGALKLCVDILERRVEDSTFWVYPPTLYVRDSSCAREK